MLPQLEQIISRGNLRSGVSGTIIKVSGNLSSFRNQPLGSVASNLNDYILVIAEKPDAARKLGVALGWNGKLGGSEILLIEEGY